MAAFHGSVSLEDSSYKSGWLVWRVDVSVNLTGLQVSRS
ncbi:hypothetical protein PSTAB_0237 [Stutzerimonas stutzeri]|uniref:Uncharacterized protein n=1 Tax=Stutzerimonas stutzeri (strain ATCC 17588 / DSM 5190 / CCUG 11256 / JCM 5965 / LMG 11199 / NBRC 14165 / NCIMB 11358 / Stanier 221) TaxID=96563 RepID=F8H581_STUS2|nr:hypothetical protein PSTAB_0237 [Stutzerimonas stutzeri]